MRAFMFLIFALLAAGTACSTPYHCGTAVPPGDESAGCFCDSDETSRGFTKLCSGDACLCLPTCTDVSDCNALCPPDECGPSDYTCMRGHCLTPVDTTYFGFSGGNSCNPIGSSDATGCQPGEVDCGGGCCPASTPYFCASTQECYASANLAYENCGQSCGWCGEGGGSGATGGSGSGTGGTSGGTSGGSGGTNGGQECIGAGLSCVEDNDCCPGGTQPYDFSTSHGTCISGRCCPGSNCGGSCCGTTCLLRDSGAYCE